MDATNMDIPSEFFDLVVDKGTYDALACDPNDKSNIKKLLLEMLRVTKPNGACVIITNGTPIKRMPDFTEWTSE